MAKNPGMESAVCEMAYWRKTQSFRELPGSTSDNPSPQQGRHSVGRGAGRETDTDLSAIASRGLRLSERFEAKQNRQGPSSHQLSADNAGGGDSNAAVR